jgi:DNA-3-methyladenine glycosylase II
MSKLIEQKAASKKLIELGSITLSEFMQKSEPLKIPGRYGKDPLLGLCRIVVGQHLSTHSASAIWDRIKLRYPDPKTRIQAFQSGSFQGLGLSKSKQKTIQYITLHGLSKIYPNDQIEPAAIFVRERLLAISGIGPWTAAMFELFVLGRPDVWSDGDLILKRVSNTLAEEAGLDRHLFIEAAKPFRSYLALSCWGLKNVLPKT